MNKGNGESGVQVGDMDARQLLEVVLDVLQTLTEKIEELTVQQAELVEKIDNISTPGVDFGYED